ncbi:MAG: hypothetical protein ACRD8O_08650, partial [Bryobacteraceae bacterium]
MKQENEIHCISGSRREFLRRAMQGASGLAVISLFDQEAIAQSNLFTNPPELTHAGGTLKAVVQLSDAMRNVPNAGQVRLRMFQGWDLSKTSSSAAPAPANAGPGPTLRTRVGGRMNIMLLNRIDDTQFSYTLDTTTTNANACDASGVNPTAGSGPTYPFVDVWPNCFHGSSTSNLHFHGTHTSPNGLGDNVLVQVIPDQSTSQAEWNLIFAEIFNRPTPPASWAEMPESYQVKQLGYTVQQFQEAARAGKKLAPAGLVVRYDTEQAAKAKRDGRTPPGSLWDWDVTQVLGRQWPQYIVGAFPNVVLLPSYPRPGLQAGQAPGTHWYHAHKHGSTSLHIFNGLAGAIIVEGDYDTRIRQFFQKQMPAGSRFRENV